MAAPPDFYIIAGPNGAGKSTFSSQLIPSGTFYFNGDLVFADLCRRYPHIEPDRLGGGVAVQLEKDRDAALAGRQNFAFESNYSNDLAVNISALFKEAGYRTHLIYFGLPDLEDSMSRVSRRLPLGGHDVPDETIAFNRSEGIKQVCKNLHLYDTIAFIDTFNRLPERVAVYYAGQASLLILNENIEWFQRDFKKSVLHLATRGKLKPGLRKGRGPRL